MQIKLQLYYTIILSINLCVKANKKRKRRQLLDSPTNNPKPKYK